MITLLLLLNISDFIKELIHNINTEYIYYN